MKNVNYHQLLNTALLGILAFMCSKFYDIGDRLVDKVNDHEVRITVLEKAQQSRDNKQTSMLHWDAILPDTKIKVKSE